MLQRPIEGLAEGLPAPLAKIAGQPRVRVRNSHAPLKSGKCVLYWMQRAERGRDNAALDVAIEVANELELPVAAFFSAIDNFPNANLRHYHFLQQGFADIEADLAERDIGFVVRRPPRESAEEFASEVDAAIVIGDENPLRAMEKRRQQFSAGRFPFWTVDADVIVPSRLLEKAQYAAQTIRPRIMRALPEFLHPFTNPTPQRGWKFPRSLERFDFRKQDLTEGWTKLDRTVGPVGAFSGGTHAALARLNKFVAGGLKGYSEGRNRPETDGSSRMSPYLHYGHIGPLTIVLAVKRAVAFGKISVEDQNSYFDELIVWRELAINLVTYNPHYDSIECADSWARSTLNEHAKDEREHLYSLEQLRTGTTHDELWNASQHQMVRFGWMHNRMRMYWAKKILEWSPSPEIAYQRAVLLNDTYFLDGRDPNGYSGIAWAIAGKFDRPWFERPIFGKIRYMSAASTGKKFNSKLYIEQYSAQPAQPSLW